MLITLTTARFLLLKTNIARIMIPKTIRIATTTAAMITPTSLRPPEESPDTECSPTPPPTGCISCEVVGAGFKENVEASKSVPGKFRVGDGIPGVDVELAAAAGVDVELATAAGVDVELAAAAGVDVELAAAAGMDVELAAAAGVDVELAAAAGVDVELAAAAGVDVELAAAAGVDVEPAAVAGVDVKPAAVAGVDVKPAAGRGIELAAAGVDTTAGEGGNGVADMVMSSIGVDVIPSLPDVEEGSGGDPLGVDCRFCDDVSDTVGVELDTTVERKGCR